MKLRAMLFCFTVIFITACDLPQEQPKEIRSPAEQAKIDNLLKIEEARRDSILKAEIQKSIKIIKVFPSKPNSAGGVNAETIFKNTSNKVIKYITFEWEPYNAVGDIVPCQIRGNQSARGTVTGPINPGQTHGYGYYWENMWYNNTIKKLVLVGIDIDYMDGSNLKINRSDIEHVYKKQID